MTSTSIYVALAHKAFYSCNILCISPSGILQSVQAVAVGDRCNLLQCVDINVAHIKHGGGAKIHFLASGTIM